MRPLLVVDPQLGGRQRPRSARDEGSNHIVRVDRLPLFLPNEWSCRNLSHERALWQVCGTSGSVGIALLQLVFRGRANVVYDHLGDEGATKMICFAYAARTCLMLLRQVHIESRSR